MSLREQTREARALEQRDERTAIKAQRSSDALSCNTFIGFVCVLLLERWL